MSLFGVVGVSIIRGNSGALVIFVIAIIGSLLNWSVCRRCPESYVCLSSSLSSESRRRGRGRAAGVSEQLIFDGR